MLAFCGLRCDTCPIFLATLETNQTKQAEMRKAIAEECNEHYDMKFLPAEITDCDGCKSNSGRLFSGCLNCKVRQCAQTLELESCAYCQNYLCSKLDEMFLTDPSAKVRLDELRQAN
jgi:hypothetical protein